MKRLENINTQYSKTGLVIIYLLFSFIPLSSTAKESDVICDSDTTIITRSKIYYPINKVDIYEDYMNNPKELELIKRYLATSPRIDSITIHSYASPEGRYGFNKWLAEERGKTAKRYLLSMFPKYRNLPDSIIHLSPIAENWEGMREEVVLNYHRADKDNVLEIIDKPGLTDEQRKNLLRRLDRGRSWQYIIKNIMPHLRYATWVSVWKSADKPIPTPALSRVHLEMPSILPPSMQIPVFVEPEPIKLEDRKTILALKSNLLYDVLSLVNYSIEVPFCGDKFSALFYHQFPWWRWGKNNNKYCVRFLGLGGEARWWFKPEPRAETEKLIKRDCLVGHFVGVYGESGKYDFERKTSVCYQGEYWSVGLSYGYSRPISKHLNLELSISAGYASIAHRGYTPSPDYSILWRDYEKIGRWHYFGLTKAQVSLVVPITVKVKKGGKL